jgi:predicted transcriptional regulator
MSSTKSASATQHPTESEAFYAFLGEQIQNGGRHTPPEELLKHWRQEFNETVEAIRRGMADIEAGRYRSLAEVDADMRQKYGIED